VLDQQSIHSTRLHLPAARACCARLLRLAACLQLKAWCYYESRLLGAHHGLISSYALEVLVLYIFNLHHAELHTPLDVSVGCRAQLCLPCCRVHARSASAACWWVNCFAWSALASCVLLRAHAGIVCLAGKLCAHGMTT